MSSHKYFCQTIDNNVTDPFVMVSTGDWPSSAQHWSYYNSTWKWPCASTRWWCKNCLFIVL